jgi:tetratricopeptide (TPR) repeat protein
LERLQESGQQRRGAVNVVRPELVKANDLLGVGEYEEAAAVLLPAWKKDPGNDAIATALKQAYKGVKNYRGVLDVLRVQLSGRPDDLVYLSELADTYWQLEKDDSALVAIKRMIAADPKDADRHHTAAETFVRAGRYPEGIETYRNARRVLGDSLIFSENLAQLFEARREYAAAVDEYFRWLAARPDSKQTVQRRITNLVRIPEAVREITAALKEIVRNSPSNEYGHRLYGDLLFESGTPDSAFAEYRRADRLAAQPGEHLLYGIERSLETRQYAIARTQAMQFLELYPKHSRITQVSFVLARAELGLGHPDVAVGMLKKLAGQIRDVHERGRIEYEIGEVYRLHTNQMDSARAYFQRVASTEDRTPRRTMALVRLGDLDVYFEDLAGADSSYRDALAARPSPDEAEEIGFRLAELRLFRGEYDQCASDLKQFAQRFPRGLYVNDALELKVLIADGKDAMNWSLDRYAGGLYATRRGQLDSALALFGQLVTDSAGKLAAAGQFQIAGIKTRQGIPVDAAAEYRSLIARFPQNSLVPRAWAAIGALCEGALADRRQARAAYQTIVTEFKDSPLVEEARLHLQRMDVP